MGDNKTFIQAPQGSATPAQVARIRAFLNTAGVKKLPSSVVLVNGDKFAQAMKDGNIDTRWAFTIPQQNRVYINADVFAQKHPNEHYNGPDFPEFILGHELSHLNDSTPFSAQAQEEHSDTLNGRANPYDLKSDDLLKTWQQNAGPAYSALKQQAPATIGTVRPSPVPLRNLVSPQAPLLGRIR